MQIHIILCFALMLFIAIGIRYFWKKAHQFNREKDRKNYKTFMIATAVMLFLAILISLYVKFWR
jgi:uncharacterized membrane protein YidH (DUF202 family)